MAAGSAGGAGEQGDGTSAPDLRVGVPYFYNSTTGLRQWEVPDEYKQIIEQKQRVIERWPLPNDCPVRASVGMIWTEFAERRSRM